MMWVRRMKAVNHGTVHRHTDVITVLLVNSMHIPYNNESQSTRYARTNPVTVSCLLC